MKLYIRDADYQRAILERFGDAITLVDSKRDAEVIITGRFTEEDAGDALKAVIIPYTGHDRIDLKLMRRRGIKLYNTTVHSRYVAEKAVQLMHAMLGKVVNYHQNLMHGDWSNRMNEHRVGWVSAFEKRIGIYGYGRIGQIIHDLLKPFSPDVFVIDRGKTYPDATVVSGIQELIEKSDIVFIAAPRTAATEGAFGKAELSLMKDKYLINVGRGPIVDEDALFWALKEETLRGYASDVWYQYPIDDAPINPSKHPLHRLTNVLMSPHCAAMTPTAPAEMRTDVLNTIDAIMRGEEPGALDLDKLTTEG